MLPLSEEIKKMAEHHIHVHIHGSQPDNNEVGLQALASAGKQAAAQNVVPDQTQAAQPVEYTTAATAILVGAIIGRKKGETSKETAVEIAKDIVALFLESELAGAYLIAAAHVAAGYLMHGSGHYKKSTIAERAAEAVSLI